ncbi:MAG: DNA polymerase III subunit delta' C-terminal domain-containing protein [Anaerolineae bacterium]|nr:AAA family ATPase [Candidatus Roseilinea sp.]MDW8449399.1 DNA polymerase III subunit delta' C-terminal domain-containing protein [Anaerolineae bacterium]
MNDWGVIGHDWAVRRLQRAIERGQLAQSHLFVGPPSIGKATLALAVARALLGRDDRSRALVTQRRHPDLLWVEPPDDGEAIKVDQIRELLHALTLAPVESRHRVAVVNDAHLITDSGQNAILKTLEEPNPSVVIVLIAPNTDTLLPTIVSRCQLLNLRPAPVHAVEEALLSRGAPSERAAFVARLSRGRIGWALRAVEDEAMLQARAERLNDLRALLAADRTQRFAYAEKLARAEPAHIAQTLEDWLLLWRNVARAAGRGASPDALVNADQREWIAQLASALPIPQIAALLRATGQTLQYLDRNVNARLALDVLLLKLPRLPAG